MLQRLEDLARQETLALRQGLAREQSAVQAKYANDPLAHIARLSDGDPTPFKRLTKAIVRWHGKGTLLLEDLYKVHDDLVIFERIKPKLPAEQRDLMRYETPRKLYELVKPYHQQEQPLPVSGKEQERNYATAMRAQSEILYDGTEGLIVIPHTREASCYWGRGTRWCTAVTKETLTNKNMFEDYNERGQLITVLLKDASPFKSKFQYHAQAEQVRDAEDESISSSILIEIAPFIRKSVKALAHLWAAKPFMFEVDQTPELNLEAVKINGRMLGYIRHQTAEICRAAIEQNPAALQDVRQQTLVLCELAVERDPRMLQHASYQTFDMCENAGQSFAGTYAFARVNAPYFLAKAYVVGVAHYDSLWFNSEQKDLLADYKDLPCSSYSGDTLLDSLRQSPCHHDRCDCLKKLGWEAKTNEKVMDLSLDEQDDITQRLLEIAYDATEVGPAIHALKARGEILKRINAKELQIAAGVKSAKFAEPELVGS